MCMCVCACVRARNPLCLLVRVRVRRCATHTDRIMESAIESVPLGVRQPLSPGCGKPLI